MQHVVNLTMKVDSDETYSKDVIISEVKNLIHSGMAHATIYSIDGDPCSVEVSPLKKYAATITETLSRTIIVEAESEEEATEQVEGMYERSKIVLDKNDFDEYVVTVQKN